MSGVLITGTNRGTGLAIARAFFGAGYEVASLNRTLRHEAWLGEVQCDLRYGREIEAATRRAVERLTSLDVCVLNAAVRRLSPIERMTDEEWDESVAVNLTSVFRLVRAVLPAIRKTRGHLILMGSQAAGQFFEGGAAYCATKAAIAALSEVLLLEARPSGVRVTRVTPGAIRNRAKTHDQHKIAPETVGRALVQLACVSTDAVVSELEIRPMDAIDPADRGIDRLLAW